MIRWHVINGIVSDLLTSEQPGTRHLRVDVAETGFFEGREFRISQELAIGSGQTQVFRFDAPIDFILQRQTLEVDAGAIRFMAYRDSQGAEGGTFTPVAMYGVNIMSGAPDYARQCSVSTGGTFAPGVGEESVETIRLRTAGSTAQRSTVTGTVGDQRGLSAGVYYLMLENIGNGEAAGVFTLKWEERPVA